MGLQTFPGDCDGQPGETTTIDLIQTLLWTHVEGEPQTSFRMWVAIVLSVLPIIYKYSFLGIYNKIRASWTLDMESYFVINVC